MNKIEGKWRYFGVTKVGTLVPTRNLGQVGNYLWVIEEDLSNK